MPATVPRTVADGMTILGLPGKIGNANTTSQANAWLFFYPPYTLVIARVLKAPVAIRSKALLV